MKIFVNKVFAGKNSQKIVPLQSQYKSINNTNENKQYGKSAIGMERNVAR